MQRPLKKKLKNAMRYNDDKLPYHMFPVAAMKAINEVFQKGAVKYEENNWRSGDGLSYNETYDSLMRHLEAWRQCEEKDKESGQLHLAHVAWNAVALLEMALSGVGVDDRFRYPEKRK